MYFKNIFHKFGKISIFYETNIPCQDYWFLKDFQNEFLSSSLFFLCVGTGDRKKLFCALIHVWSVLLSSAGYAFVTFHLH